MPIKRSLLSLDGAARKKRRATYSLPLNLLIGAIRRAGTDGAKREESVEDTLIYEIQLGLKAVEKFMQTALDDMLGVRICQLGAQLAKPLLSGIAVHADRCACNGMKRIVRCGQAVMD